ncbi:hypothetical protein P9112_013778 [Eukaryota sp. TZLM1-RC]
MVSILPSTKVSVENQAIVCGAHSDIHFCHYGELPALVEIFHNSECTVLESIVNQLEAHITSHHVIKSHGITKLGDGRLGLVMEKVDSTLKSMLPGKLSPVSLSLALDVVDAVQYLLSEGITHLSLTSSAIFVQNLKIKLHDVVLSKIIQDLLDQEKTSKHCIPNTLSCTQPCTPITVCLGFILYEILCGKSFATNSFDDQTPQFQDLLPQIPDDFPQDLAMIIKQCWYSDQNTSRHVITELSDLTTVLKSNLSKLLNVDLNLEAKTLRKSNVALQKEVKSLKFRVSQLEAMEVRMKQLCQEKKDKIAALRNDMAKNKSGAPVLSLPPAHDFYKRCDNALKTLRCKKFKKNTQFSTIVNLLSESLESRPTVTSSHVKSVLLLHQTSQLGHSSDWVSLVQQIQEFNLLSSIKNLADEGHCDAQVLLGDLHFHGRIVTKCFTTAALWFKKASILKNTNGMAWFGNCLYNGWGVDIDGEGAFKLAKQATEHDNPIAMVLLGCCYSNGIGVDKSPSRALSLFESAFRAGFRSASKQLYWHYRYILNDIHTAVSWLAKGACCECSTAMVLLARCYDSGDGVKKDGSKALELLNKAARLQDASAYLELGKAHKQGLGSFSITQPNYEAAKEMFKTAIDLGSAQGLSQMGILFEEGLGVKKDIVNAFECYTNGVSYNDEVGFVRLGFMYTLHCDFPRPVPVDLEKAVNLLFKGNKKNEGHLELRSCITKLFERQKVMEDVEFVQFKKLVSRLRQEGLIK